MATSRITRFLFILLSYNVYSGLAVDKFPRFLDRVPNITRTVGRDALLTCNVDQLSGYKVAWVQVDSQTILTIHKQVITRNPRISLLHDDHRSWHLQIKDLNEADRGWYMCQVNTDPMRSVQGYLDVVVPPDIIDKDSSGDMIVLEGEDVTLKCRAKGHPQPNIAWRREDGQDITLDTDNKVSVVHGETLSMKKVSRLHMGSYLCIASNSVPPSISKRIHLKIHFPPVAWVPQQLESAYIGQQLTIECHTEAFPNSINYWTNDNDEMIVSDDRYDSILAKSTYKVYMKLIIKRIQPSDFGTFRCIAKNSLGETDGAIKIYKIEAPPTFRPKTFDYEDKISMKNKSNSYQKKRRKKQRKKVESHSPNHIVDEADEKKQKQVKTGLAEFERTNNYFFDTFSDSCQINNLSIFLILMLTVFVMLR